MINAILDQFLDNGWANEAESSIRTTSIFLNATC